MDIFPKTSNILNFKIFFIVLTPWLARKNKLECKRRIKIVIYLSQILFEVLEKISVVDRGPEKVPRECVQLIKDVVSRVEPEWEKPASGHHFLVGQHLAHLGHVTIIDSG